MTSDAGDPDSEIDYERVKQAVAVLGGLSEQVSTNPEMRRRVVYDLHAILNGWPTLGHFSERDQATVRVMMGFTTPEELTELVGPADVSLWPE